MCNQGNAITSDGALRGFHFTASPGEYEEIVGFVILRPQSKLDDSQREIPTYEIVSVTSVILTSESETSVRYVMHTSEQLIHVKNRDIVGLAFAGLTAVDKLCMKNPDKLSGALMWRNANSDLDLVEDMAEESEIACDVSAVYSASVTVTAPESLSGKAIMALSPGQYVISLLSPSYQPDNTPDTPGEMLVLAEAKFAVEEAVGDISVISPSSRYAQVGGNIVFVLAINRGSNVFCNWTVDNRTQLYSDTCPHWLQYSTPECQVSGYQFVAWQHEFRTARSETVCFTSTNAVSSIDTCLEIHVEPVLAEVKVSLQSNSVLALSQGKTLPGRFWVKHDVISSPVAYRWTLHDLDLVTFQPEIIVPISEAGTYTVQVTVFNNVSRVQAVSTLLAFEVIEDVYIIHNSSFANALALEQFYLFTAKVGFGSNLSYTWLVNDQPVGIETGIVVRVQQLGDCIVDLIVSNEVSSASVSLSVSVEQPISGLTISPSFDTVQRNSIVTFNSILTSGSSFYFDWFLCQGENCTLIGQGSHVTTRLTSVDIDSVRVHAYNRVSSQWESSYFRVTSITDSGEEGVIDPNDLNNPPKDVGRGEGGKHNQNNTLLPTPISGLQLLGCCRLAVMVGGNVTLFAIVSHGNPVFYNWTIGTNPPAYYFTQNLTIAFNESGNFTISVSASNANSMQTEVEVARVLPPFVIEVTIHADQDLESVFEGQNVTLFAVTKPAPATLYTWTTNGQVVTGVTGAAYDMTRLVSGQYDVTVNASTPINSAWSSISFKVHQAMCKPPKLVVVGGKVK